jgi:tetratricopeptide (TPR) repeat protein
MKLWKKCLAASLIVVTSGCAGSNAIVRPRTKAVGHYDMAVIQYAKALELDPTNAGYKAALARATLRASQIHFEKGKMYRASGRPDLAVVELSQTVLLDPTNDYAKVELRKAEEELARQQRAGRRTGSRA